MAVFRNILCVLIFCLIDYSNSSYYDDHCWVDYDGIIPPNALGAGLDKQGNVINIGQVLHENMIQVGEVYKKKKGIILYEYYGSRIGRKNIKILCTEHPERFEWIPVAYNETQNVGLKKFLVLGGYESDTHEMYIGRVLINGELRIGKVECSHGCTVPLHIVHFNGKYHNLATFEILTYNESPTNSDIIN